MLCTRNMKSQKKLNTVNITLTKKQIQKILFSLSKEELYNLGYTKINHKNKNNNNCNDLDKKINTTISFVNNYLQRLLNRMGKEEISNAMCKK